MAVKSFYEVLDVPPTASPDEIRRAFRRALALYHPDKVQHLGREFHEIAAAKTAEITAAYRALRSPSAHAGHHAQVATTAVPSRGDRGFSADRAEAAELVRRAVLGRVRDALRQECGVCEEPFVDGFDVAGVSPRTWRRGEVRVLVRLAPVVDVSAVRETAARARRLSDDGHRQTCVLVMGQAASPLADLGKAIDDLRRRALRADGTLIIVPIDIRTWCAHVPADAPLVVRALVDRLQAA